MAKKYTERYESFCNCLESLKRAKDRDLEDEFVLSGTIQKFSLTFDIAWKVMKDVIVKYHGINEFATGSPRETLRIAATVKLISDDKWMNMLEDRNNLTYDYDGKLAVKKVKVIIEEYIPLLIVFQKKVSMYIDKMKLT